MWLWRSEAGEVAGFSHWLLGTSSGVAAVQPPAGGGSGEAKVVRFSEVTWDSVPSWRGRGFQIQIQSLTFEI